MTGIERIILKLEALKPKIIDATRSLEYRLCVQEIYVGFCYDLVRLGVKSEVAREYMVWYVENRVPKSGSVGVEVDGAGRVQKTD